MTLTLDMTDIDLARLARMIGTCVPVAAILLPLLALVIA